MIYAYLIATMLSSVLIMQRSIIYVQMNNYIMKIKDGLRREFIYISIFTIINIVNSLVYIYTQFDELIYCILSGVFILVFTFFMIHRSYKVSPNYTNRLKRLIMAYLVVTCLKIVILLLIIWYFRSNLYNLLIINVIYVTNFLLLYPINRILCIFENANNQRYIDSAKSILSSYNNIRVIGITGSFGKTSIKNYLYTLLSVKYKVAATPKSYNTPLGIAMSINQLKGDEDFFLVEMGARYNGDVKYLCDMVHPKYGIISGVTEQHLDTFKDIKNIEKTKYELYESLPKDGYCVFNGNNDISYKMYNYSNSANCIMTQNENSYIDNISMNSNGTTFDICLFGERRSATTKIIGLHNIQNILLASTLAYHLGLSIDDIVKGIENIEQVPHRCEIIVKNGITIIDDTYNANINGVKSSIDTLNFFDGRKIVASQGIVEGGKKEVDLNILIGRYIAKVATYAVLIGKERKYIYKGLLDQGFKLQNIFLAKNLKEAEHIFAALIRQGDVVLLSNDLPDNY